MEKQIDIKKSSLVLLGLFLSMEAIGFSATGSNILAMVGKIIFVALLFMCGFVLLKNLSKKDLKSIIIPLGLVIFFTFTTLLSKPNNQLFGVFQNVLTSFAILGAFILGMFLNRYQDKKDVIFLSLFAVLGLYVLINLIATLANYGFFHTLLYADKYYYYNAIRYSISNEVKMITNSFINFRPVSIAYYSLFTTLLSSILPALLFINIKDKRRFFVALGLGSLGVLSNVLLGNFSALLYLIAPTLLGLYFKFIHSRFKGNKKFEIVRKVIFIGLLVVASLFFIFALLLAINASDIGFANKIANNAVLNKIFNDNRFVNELYLIENKVKTSSLENILKGTNFFGFDLTKGTQDTFLVNQPYMEMEVLRTQGILGFIAFFLIIVFAIYRVHKYINDSKDGYDYKTVIISFLLVFISYYSLNADSFPLVIKEDLDYYGLFTHGLVYIAIMFFGYISIRDEQPDKVLQEQPQSVESEALVNEYVQETI